MRRFLATCAACCLLTAPLLAASPQVESAIKVFKAVSGDANKLKMFCAMTKAMDAAGDKPTAAQEAQISGQIKQLGADFEKAWGAAESLKQDSPDAKAYDAALDDLASKCPN